MIFDLFDLAVDGLWVDPFLDELLGFLPFEEIGISVDEFEYQHLILKTTPPLVGGIFPFIQEQVKESLPVSGGKFDFEMMKIDRFELPKPKRIIWGEFFWGDGHIYGQMIMNIEKFPYEQVKIHVPTEISGRFEFDHIQVKTGSKALGSFNYRRL